MSCIPVYVCHVHEPPQRNSYAFYLYSWICINEVLLILNIIETSHLEILLEKIVVGLVES